MAYKFQRGDATYSGSLTIDEDLSVTEAITGTTSITAGTSFIIGSADLNEADMEKLDGITNGTAAASKAIVLDSDKGITGISTLTASFFKGDGSALTGISSDNVDVADTSSDLNYQLVAVTASGDGVSLVTVNTLGDRVQINGSTGKLLLEGPGIQIGSADITEAEFEFLDGATAGSVVNSKAVVYSAAGVVQGTDFKGPDGFDIGNASVNDMIKLNAAEVVFKDGNLTVDIASADAASYGLKLAGTLITSTAAELNLIDGSSAGTVVNSKAAIYSAGGHLNGTQLSSSFGISGSALTLGGTAVGASANDLNLAQGMAQSTGTAVASAFVALDEDKAITGILNLTASAAKITTVDINGGAIDGAVIGAASAASGTFSGVVVSSLSISDGAISNVSDISLDSISADGASFSFASNWTAASRTCADLGTVTTADLNGGTIDGASIGVTSAAVVTASYLAVNGNVDLGDGSDVINVNGRLDFGGGASANMQQISANDTLAQGDFYNMVSASTAVTVTLPGNSGLTDGTIFYVKRANGMTNNVTVAVADENSEQLDGESSIVLESALAAVQLIWDSTAANWHVF